MTLEQTKKFTEQDENTLQYYNQNATTFIADTIAVLSLTYPYRISLFPRFTAGDLYPWILAVVPERDT